MTPSSSEPPLIRAMVNVMAARRPNRSANTPTSSPPSGRMKNPTAKTAKELSTGTSGSSLAGKICPAKYTVRNE